jgi:hypothetical protein
MKEFMNRFFSNRQNKIIGLIFLSLGVISFIIQYQSQPSKRSDEELPTSADTYIPEGMVLIPIEIQNKEALSSIMSQFGIIDLYLPSFGETIKSKKIATGVKIMRAPLNPDVYAVLVREDQASHITEFSGPFIATIQSPHKKQTQFSKKEHHQKIEIIYEDHL